MAGMPADTHSQHTDTEMEEQGGGNGYKTRGGAAARAGIMLSAIPFTTVASFTYSFHAFHSTWRSKLRKRRWTPTLRRRRRKNPQKSSWRCLFCSCTCASISFVHQRIEGYCNSLKLELFYAMRGLITLLLKMTNNVDWRDLIDLLQEVGHNKEIVGWNRRTSMHHGLSVSCHSCILQCCKDYRWVPV